jgi:small-conductance mechanosensitive channel
MRLWLNHKNDEQTGGMCSSMFVNWFNESTQHMSKRFVQSESAVAQRRYAAMKVSTRSHRGWQWLAILMWLICLPVPAAVPMLNGEPDAVAADQEARVRVFNRDVVTFRAAVFGVSATDRAHRVEFRIKEQMERPGPLTVNVKADPAGQLIQIDGETAFLLTPGDLNPVSEETLPQAAAKSAKALETVIEESRESRDLRSLGVSAAVATGITLALWLIWWLIRKGLVLLQERLTGWFTTHPGSYKVAGVEVMQAPRLASWLLKLIAGLRVVLLMIVLYQWLSLILSIFPFTRAWGERLHGFLWDVVFQISSAVLGALPRLFVAVLIFLLAHWASKALDGLFGRIRDGRAQVDWLSADVAEPTRKIAKAVTWLFALAMAYPYIPGSQTQAFQGLSVLLGLMLSLGASNLVGQGASGLILIYGRVFKPGEFVRIGEFEGTVMELGMFATRIRTGLGEELTIANSAVLGSTTKNYSRTVKGKGFVLDTQVTIGYDTPWRQVHAMLQEAARRTEGILVDPAPQVFQTALSDWYPQYRLVCQAIPTSPGPRAMILSALHANIQDVFNEYGVQIMSPQYFADPAEPKVVPRDRWFTAPARDH